MKIKSDKIVCRKVAKMDEKGLVHRSIAKRLTMYMSLLNDSFSHSVGGDN